MLFTLLLITRAIFPLRCFIVMTSNDILVPVNLDKYSRQGLEFAASVSAELPVRTTLLYVVELNIFPYSCRVYDEVCREYLLRLQTLAQRAFNKEPRLCVRMGRPNEQILAEAGESGADLIVMAISKTPRPKWRFGQTTIERVVRDAPCLTLVLSDSWKINTPQYRRMLPASLLNASPQELVHQ
jgi:nucleotide-binding universal stress UspA family protein